jgi:hypothetical protein
MNMPKFEVIIEIRDTETEELIIDDCYYTNDLEDIINDLEDIIEKIRMKCDE